MTSPTGKELPMWRTFDGEKAAGELVPWMLWGPNSANKLIRDAGYVEARWWPTWRRWGNTGQEPATHEADQVCQAAQSRRPYGPVGRAPRSPLLCLRLGVLTQFTQQTAGYNKMAARIAEEIKSDTVVYILYTRRLMTETGGSSGLWRREKRTRSTTKVECRMGNCMVDGGRRPQPRRPRRWKESRPQRWRREEEAILGEKIICKLLAQQKICCLIVYWKTIIKSNLINVC